ncbi:hypothetical protein NDU88_000637 [Pleurodeles waltl]|uniref:Uncharacterized protein n=1 Tax=Pleurodeles waltl TaxID=8319 RepID=A0AAV7USF7_PLEWA|nr:hypothetical protein NDU88_000637 [Pleurodeles waltl]
MEPVSALQDATYREDLRGHIGYYFEINENTASDVGAEWDAFKVVLLLRLDLQDLESKLQHYEQLLPTDAGAATSLENIRITHQQALDRLTQLHYSDYQTRKHAEGDKGGKLLALLLWSEHAHTPITAL